MKAIKIDVAEKEVYEVDLEARNGSQLDSIYTLIEAQPFCVGVKLWTGDYVYVDDNGLLRDQRKVPGYFTIEGQSQTLVGHGLVCGVDPQGESQDVVSTVEEIRRKVTFKNSL